MTATGSDSNPLLTFSGWELDVDRAELRRRGETCEIQPKLLDLLLYLAQHRDRWVSRSELFDHVWADVVVSDTAVSSALKDLRRLLGDDGTHQRVIQTRRGVGYRFVADLGAGSGLDRSPLRRLGLAAPGEARRSETASRAREAPLLGRRVEQTALREALDEAADGAPRLVLVSGAAGIGKTRLVESFAAGPAGDTARVVTGRATQGQGFPYRPVIAALGSLVVADDDPDAESYGEDLAPIRELLHPDPERAFDWDAAPSIASERERAALFERLSSALVRLSRTQPIALVIEDLHFADGATLDLIAHLALVLGSAERPVRCLMIATFRPDPADARVAGALERLARSGIARSLRLSGLDELATTRLVEACGLRHPDRQLARVLHDASGGNPLFVRELASHYLRRLHATGVGTLARASSLDSLLGERLSQLSDDCRDALTVAAFIGDRFSRLTLLGATATSREELDPLLAEAVAAGVLQRDGAIYRFDHSLIRHVLYSEVPDEEAGRIHAHVAAVLEELYATSIDDRGHARRHALEISDHLIRAGSEVAPERLIPYARAAGEQAYAVCAWGEAARHFAAAADAALDLTEAERAQLHFRAAVACNHDQRADEAVDHYAEAIRGFAAVGDARGLVWARMLLLRARLTIALDRSAAAAEAAQLRDALGSLPREEAVLRGLALETIAEAHWMAGENAEAVDAASRALVIGNNANDDVLSHHACLGLALACFQQLRVVEALEYWERSLAHGERSRDPWLETVPPARIAMSQLALGRHREATAAAEDGMRRVQRAQCWAEVSMIHAQQAALRYLRGELQWATDLCAEALAMIERSGYPWAGPTLVPVLAASEALRGDGRAASAALNLLVEPGRIFPKPGRAAHTTRDAYAVWLSALPGGAGAPSDTRVRSLVERIARARPDPYSLGAACALVQACALRGEPDQAQSLLPVLEQATGQGIRFSPGCPVLIPRVVGELHLARKDHERAAAALEEAVSVARASGAALELGLSLCALHAARAGGGDPDAATRAYAEAARVLHALDLDALVPAPAR